MWTILLFPPPLCGCGSYTPHCVRALRPTSIDGAAQRPTPVPGAPPGCVCGVLGRIYGRRALGEITHVCALDLRLRWDRSSGESHPTCFVVGDGVDKSPRLDNSALAVVRGRIFGASFGPWSRRRHISHTRQVREMLEAEGEGMSYFSQGLVARHAPQHTTHAPRGGTGDWGGRLGRAIDRCWSQGPHAAWYVTATPTQRRRKQQDGPHVLLPAYSAVPLSCWHQKCAPEPLPGLSYPVWGFCRLHHPPPSMWGVIRHCSYPTGGGRSRADI